jgi:hypothetical protein
MKVKHRCVCLFCTCVCLQEEQKELAVVESQARQELKAAQQALAEAQEALAVTSDKVCWGLYWALHFCMCTGCVCSTMTVPQCTNAVLCYGRTRRAERNKDDVCTSTCLLQTSFLVCLQFALCPTNTSHMLRYYGHYLFCSSNPTGQPVDRGPEGGQGMPTAVAYEQLTHSTYCLLPVLCYSSYSSTPCEHNRSAS